MNIMFRRSVERIVQPPAWSVPTLLNSWVNYGGAYTIAGYYKDAMSIVHLRGTVKSGTATPGTAILTLPLGYRPVYQHIFTISSNDVYGQVQINTSGDVTINVGSNVYLSLDNIHFRAE
jgi:hypothetical protein